MVLTAAELAEARTDMADTLPDTCVVTSVTRTRNDSGGWTETTVDSDPIACRLGPLSGSERVIGGRVAEESNQTVTLAWDADVEGADRITHDGVTYEVVDILERTDRLVRRVYVRRGA